VPKTKRCVRLLCGTIGFLRTFTPQCASYSKPLHDNKSSNIVKWNDRHQAALEQIKGALTSQPVLDINDPGKRHVLQTYSSDSCVGGVLLQEEDNG